jgi:hypothetical protein
MLVASTLVNLKTKPLSLSTRMSPRSSTRDCRYVVVMAWIPSRSVVLADRYVLTRLYTPVACSGAAGGS